MHRSLEFFHEQLTIRLDQRVPVGESTWPGTVRRAAGTAMSSARRGHTRVWHTRVSLRGVLDIETCPWARTVFDHVLDQTGVGPASVSQRPGPDTQHLMLGPPWWVLDTQQLRFLSAGGLTVLEDLAVCCRDAGGGLTLVGHSRAVRRVLNFSDPLGAWSEFSPARGIIIVA